MAVQSIRATVQVLSEVGDERARQDKKWGEQNHGNDKWLAILGEEFGEACQAALKQKPSDVKDFRKECIQVAAVAVAIVECLDRGSPERPTPGIIHHSNGSLFELTGSDDEFLSSYGGTDA